MEWLIYVILAFIYWKHLYILGCTYLTVILTTFCWYAVDELVSRKMSYVGGDK